MTKGATFAVCDQGSAKREAFGGILRCSLRVMEALLVRCFERTYSWPGWGGQQCHVVARDVESDMLMTVPGSIGQGSLLCGNMASESQIGSRWEWLSFSSRLDFQNWNRIVMSWLAHEPVAIFVVNGKIVLLEKWMRVILSWGPLQCKRSRWGKRR